MMINIDVVNDSPLETLTVNGRKHSWSKHKARWRGSASSDHVGLSSSSHRRANWANRMAASGSNS